nr:MFS transporter [Galbitalea soli]
MWAGRTAALLGILLVALNLRTAVAAISPIVTQISADVPLGALLVGVIGSAPPVIFSLSGVVGPWVARRLGLERGLLVSVLAMIAGDAARVLATDAAVLVAGTGVIFAGVGVTNILLPPLVKRYFPDRIGLVTTLYTTLMSVSTALPALAAAPVSDAAGWRVSLLVWLVLVIPAALPWAALVVRRSRGAQGDAAASSVEHAGLRVWRSSVAWGIAGVFALAGLNAYALFAWLPSILVERSQVSPAVAGSLLALFAIMGFPAALVVPILAERMRSVAPLVFTGVALLVVGHLGLILLPTRGIVLWVVLGGLGPLLFPLALVLINARTRTHAGSVALSGFVQSIGYLIAALGPFLVGALHQATGEWITPLVVLLVLSALGVVPAILVARPRFVEDELAGVSPAVPAGG